MFPSNYFVCPASHRCIFPSFFPLFQPISSRLSHARANTNPSSHSPDTAHTREHTCSPHSLSKRRSCHPLPSCTDAQARISHCRYIRRSKLLFRPPQVHHTHIWLVTQAPSTHTHARSPSLFLSTQEPLPALSFHYQFFHYPDKPSKFYIFIASFISPPQASSASFRLSLLSLTCEPERASQSPPVSHSHPTWASASSSLSSYLPFDSSPGARPCAPARRLPR